MSFGENNSGRTRNYNLAPAKNSRVCDDPVFGFGKEFGGAMFIY